MHNILEILQDRTDCTYFLKSINETNFGNIFTGNGPFTVLVPFDEAYNNLPKDFLSNLYLDKNTLIDIVSQHVFAGKHRDSDFKKMDEIKNMNNFNLAIEVHNEGLILGGAKVVEPNINASNGIIHIVDVVLLP